MTRCDMIYVIFRGRFLTRTKKDWPLGPVLAFCETVWIGWNRLPHEVLRSTPEQTQRNKINLTGYYELLLV